MMSFITVSRNSGYADRIRAFYLLLAWDKHVWLRPSRT
jgi:hypothetical protein